MKRLLFGLCFCLLVQSISFGQTRKYISQFNQLQSYFNPALTSYEGSTVRGFVRDQWSGLEGAPRTYFFSLEFDPAEISKGYDASLLGKTAIGLNLVQDNYGPFMDTELMLSYSSRVRLGKATNLRLGAAVNYNTIRLDGNNLTTEMAADPTLSQFLNSFADMTIIDFNLGAALTHQNYYLAYGVQNVNRGQISRGEVFLDQKSMVHIFQTGFRQPVNENLSLFSHVLYRIQSDLPSNIELNVKAMLKEKVWIGIGHRVDYATNFQLGFLMQKIRFGYAYEIPASRAFLIPNPTHEFMASFFIFRKMDRAGDMGDVIW